MGKALFAVFALALGARTALALEQATAEIGNAEGRAIGKAVLRQGPTGVLIFIEASGLPPGPHGLHLHGVGACDPDFKAAKGHVNPHGKAHGLLNPEGPDRGDLPNVFVASDGTLTVELFTTAVALRDGPAPLLDADGSAFIIHENRDDHMTQPIGGAGGRIACGVIKPL